jgi:hypothetical protein
MVFKGKVLSERLVTYCCGQFVVNRQRVINTNAAAKEFYANLDNLVRNSWYQKCNIEHMSCYILEFFWHVVFGEPATLPRRLVI